MESVGSQARNQEAVLSTLFSSAEYIPIFLVQLRPSGLTEQAGQVRRQRTEEELQKENDQAAEEGDGFSGNGAESQLSTGGDEENGVAATEPARTSRTHCVAHEGDGQ